MLTYTKRFFDPAAPIGTDARFETLQPGSRGWACRVAGIDEPYVFSEEAILALNIALAARRPLLVSGEPGCGKTSLAKFAARALGHRFYRQTVSSRTQSSDLLSSFDAVRRLRAAQSPDGSMGEQAYVKPGNLWWAMAPTSARTRGTGELAAEQEATDPGSGGGARTGATLLIDEIDKADPDVPNDLLEVLDECSFTVPETGDVIAQTREQLLVILTTNGEREMPPAFLRRCIMLRLPDPTEEWLVDIARRRFGEACATLAKRFAALTIERRASARDAMQRPPGTSEYLDALQAWQALCENESPVDSGTLDPLLDAALSKHAAQRDGN